MAYITNDGARLIERAKTEGKSIVLGSVRMNTIYKEDPTSLVQKSDEWFGENRGSVVGCLSHVSVDDVSKVCDSKLAVQCNDNSESWKSLGIYARLDGEEGEVLFACESIENGEYKDVTIVELPVTLDGVVEDFGLSEGGSGGGGGGEVPANMMTTDTAQTGLSGTKTWSWETYSGSGTVDNPQEDDIKSREFFTICNIAEGENHIPLAFEGSDSRYSSKEGWYTSESRLLDITSRAVRFNESSASWSDIINAAKIKQGFNHAYVHQTSDGSIEIGGKLVKPNSDIKIGDARLAIDSNSKIASVRADYGAFMLDISAAVFDDYANSADEGSVHRVSGIVSEVIGLSFNAPIPLAEGQLILIHWVEYPNP